MPRKKKEWVLIIADERALQEEVRGIVEGEGFHPVVVGGWMAARKALAHGTSPCLVLLDGLIPGADEFAMETARRKRHNVATIPVRLERTGGVVTKKPVRLDVLIEALRKHCAVRLEAVGS